MTTASNPILERNLEALERLSPEMCRLVRNATPHAGVEFLETEEGEISAAIVSAEGGPGTRRLLASRRRPREEGERLAATVELQESGAVVVSGFGLGYHVGALAERAHGAAAMVVFEPDVALLRAVLERVDHTTWLTSANVLLVSDPSDNPTISRFVQSREALFALGVKLLEHPASKVRLGSGTGVLFETVAGVTRALRTTLVTSLVQIRATLRNSTMNLDRYVRCPGIADLAGAAAGRPAIVVSAGPSLARNIECLADPSVRDRFVIIAVQTVLKTLLAHGIRPHYVTALDHAEISARFYEGLSASDVEGVTLVAEPKVNPSVLEAYPGQIRLAGDSFLDVLLGQDLARVMGYIRAGSTVAHLAYYLARHLGCDPVVLVGQDLGFTDGQYYGSGAAIHNVWAGELGEFRTLEMMEWERIVRMRMHLQSRRDMLDRPVFTDAQMETYLLHFEREFKADSERGLCVIDATEGGVRKAGTECMRLSEVIETLGVGAEPIRLPAGEMLSAERVALTRERLGLLCEKTANIGSLSEEAADFLDRMDERFDEVSVVERLIGELHEVRSRVKEQEPAFTLVQHLNQIGGFTRLRADRAIDLKPDMPARERQRCQIRRDRVNVASIGDSSELLGMMLEEACGALDGGQKRTRELPAADSTVQVGAEQRVAAMIPVNPETGGRGHARDLGRTVFDGRGALRLTLERLARCERVGEAVLLTHEPERVRHLIGAPVPGLDVKIEHTERAMMSGRSRAVGIARAWSGVCWRGGLGGATCFDEICDAAPMHEAMVRHGIGAALLVGADWAFVDPDVCDEVIASHLVDQMSYRLTFSQAVPGLGGCVITRSLMHDLHANMGSAGALGTIGSLLSYHPRSPMIDQIAAPVCARVDPALRDAGVRLIADTDASIQRIRMACARLGTRAVEKSGVELCRAIGDAADGMVGAGPDELTIDAAHPDAERLLMWYRSVRRDGAVTIIGRGESLEPALDLVVEARRAGCHAVHLRTDLLAEERVVRRLSSADPDVVSIDVHAAKRETYERLTGAAFEPVRDRLQSIANDAELVGGLPHPWLVARITRCDAVYEEIESFYDGWLATTGVAVIDALESTRSGERIEPIHPPASYLRRVWRDTLCVGADGGVLELGADGCRCRASVGMFDTDDPGALWTQVRRDRMARLGFAEIGSEASTEEAAA